MAIKNLTDTHILGKLGVGTSNPTSTLQVDGQVLISATAPLLDFVDTNSFSDANDRFRVRAGSNQGLIQWYDDSSSSLLSIMTFEPNGNVIIPNGSLGVGTTTPIGSLDVANDGLFLTSTNTSSRNWLVAGNYLSWGDFALVQSDAFGTDPYPPANSTPRFYINTLGKVGIGTTSPSSTLTVNGRIEVLKDDISNTSEGGHLTLRAGSNYNYRFSIDNYQDNFRVVKEDDSSSSNGTVPLLITADGNVGIGTTSPSEKLSVAGNIALASNNSFISFNTSASSGDPKIQMGSDGDFSFLNTAGSTTLHIENGGNVGIGTTSPNASLHIEKAGDQTSSVKGITLSSGAGGTNKYLPSITWSYGAYGTPDFAKIESQRAGGTGARILFSTASSSGTMSEAMRINEDGNVGIGTTSPSAAGGYTPTLHIASPYPALAIQNTATGSRKYQLGVDSVAAFNIYDANDTETRLSIASNGNVFIGNPPVFGAMEKLQVLGGLMVGDGAGRDYIEGFGTGELLSNDAITGELRVGGGVLSANPMTMEFTFLGEPVLYGNVSEGTIPMRSQTGVSESGFEDNDFGPNNYGILLGPGVSYTMPTGGGAPVGYPEFAYSGMMGGLVCYDQTGFISQNINSPSGDMANFSSSMGMGDVGCFQGAFTWNYTYGSQNMSINPAMLEFKVFDFLGPDQLFFDPANANTLFAPSFSPTSDRKLKENITNAPGLEVVKKLQGVEFDWKSNGKHSSGFIAQEVEEVIPHAVVESDTHKALNYNAILAYQNEAIKELSDMVDLLKQEIEILKNK